MSTLEQAARQALYTLQRCAFRLTDPAFVTSAINVLRAALAQQQAEPEQANTDLVSALRAIAAVCEQRELATIDVIFDAAQIAIAQYQCTLTQRLLSCKKPVKQAEPVVDLYAVQSAVLIEREACARLCESTTASWTQHLYNEGCMDCAKAIRGQSVASEPDDDNGNPSY